MTPRTRLGGGRGGGTQRLNDGQFQKEQKSDRAAWPLGKGADLYLSRFLEWPVKETRGKPT